jgi:hypothetical protein
LPASSFGTKNEVGGLRKYEKEVQRYKDKADEILSLLLKNT